VLAVGLDVLDDDITDTVASGLQYDAFRECRDSLTAADVDIAAYNTVENAADVADLRTALGYEEWNLYGISYGTRLALEVMRDHPEGIRSVILDSAFPHQVDSMVAGPGAARRAFEKLFAGCAADAACAADYPDLETVLWEQVARFNAEPVMLQITYIDGRRFDALVDGEGLLGTFFQALYSAEVIPLLPAIVSEIAADDYRNFTTLVANFTAVLEFVSFGMHTSVQCREEVAFADPAAVDAAAAAIPDFGALFVDETGSAADGFALCEMWGAGAADALENEAVMSDIATLVLAGEYDPITPPDWGRMAAAGLASSFFFEFPGLGHAVSVADECPLSIALAFLDDPADAPSDACLAQMRGPEFLTTTDRPADPLVMVPFEIDEFGVVISGLVPDGWEDVGFGAFVRGTNALDQTALVQQAVAGGSIDFTLDLLAGQLGIEGDLEPAGDLIAGGRVWNLYRASVQGYLADIAVADGNPLGVLILLLSRAEERDVLYSTVLLPVLETVSVR
jgi:pimeloyl-ACP methyl ester carboxylesterase